MKRQTLRLNKMNVYNDTRYYYITTVTTVTTMYCPAESTGPGTMTTITTVTDITSFYYTATEIVAHMST